MATKTPAASPAPTCPREEPRTDEATSAPSTTPVTRATPTDQRSGREKPGRSHFRKAGLRPPTTLADNTRTTISTMVAGPNGATSRTTIPVARRAIANQVARRPLASSIPPCFPPLSLPMPTAVGAAVGVRPEGERVIEGGGHAEPAGSPLVCVPERGHQPWQPCLAGGRHPSQHRSAAAGRAWLGNPLPRRQAIGDGYLAVAAGGDRQPLRREDARAPDGAAGRLSAGSASAE